MADLRILFCASEVSPYAKTGGLADVAGSLPAALKDLGCDVRIFMPLYRPVRNGADALAPVAENLKISIGIHDYRVHLWEGSTQTGLPIYFLEKDEFFDRSFLYGSPGRGDYDDNAERFIAFCRGVYALCTQLNWVPDIFHLHDWQTALISAYHYLRWRYVDRNFTHSGTVFTIHNLGYQGLFPPACFSLTHLPPEAFSMAGMEFWGQCNFLKAGLSYSDFLTTVSPRYSEEIQTSEFGHGLEGVLQERQDDLAGILNGVDYSVWNPETDPYLPAHYNALRISGKQRCKRELLSELGLPQAHENRPLLGMISRLVKQKGFDLLAEILEDLMEHPVCMVILGTGEPEIEQELQSTAEHYPDRLKLILQFDEALAHKIEAAADMFLMPSRYEPCGLNQMYSLRYGTIPIVHATGGLDDSVVDILQNPHTGTGFKFYDYKAPQFLYNIRSAIELFHNKEKWLELVQRAMVQDFSWSRSAREYMKIYQEVLERKTKQSVY